MDATKLKSSLLIAAVAALAIQVLTWFVFYPLAGYNDVTLAIAQLAFFLLGVGLVFALRIGWRRIGLKIRDLALAVTGIILAYALILILLLLLNRFGGQLAIFRQQYHLYALLNNWLLTGLGEELVFAGVLFNLMIRIVDTRRRWNAVLLTAGLFALWHLPGYLAVGLRMGTLGFSLVIDLLLHVISWSIFGTIYLLSGNLWLTAFVHASTDYPLLPIVTDNPLIGLFFMAIVIAFAVWIRRRRVPIAQA